jgi:hypothetical protein
MKRHKREYIEGVDQSTDTKGNLRTEWTNQGREGDPKGWSTGPVTGQLGETGPLRPSPEKCGLRTLKRNNTVKTVIIPLLLNDMNLTDLLLC